MSRDVSTQTNNIVSQESTLRHDVKKLLADNQKLYDDNQRQIDCSIAHIAQINDLISQLQKARENNFKLSVALETAQQNCQIATDQNEKLKKMLGQAEIKEGKRLRQELEELQHENEVLQAKIQQHHFNASTMKKDRLSLENQIVLLERKLEKTQEGVTLLQDKIRLLLLENDNLKKQLLGKSIQIDILL